MEMLDHRGILDRFVDGNPTPPFVNFGMFPLDLRMLDFPILMVCSFGRPESKRCCRNMLAIWEWRFVDDMR
jgi:hypothetical protein